LADKRNAEATTDFAREQIRDLAMTRNRLDRSRSWIRPERVRTALTFEVAAVLAEMLNEGAALH